MKDALRLNLQSKEILREITNPELPTLMSTKTPTSNPKITFTRTPQTSHKKPLTLEQPTDLELMKNKLREKNLYLTINGLKSPNANHQVAFDTNKFTSIFKNFFIMKGLLPADTKKNFKIKAFPPLAGQKLVQIFKNKAVELEEANKIGAQYAELKPFYPYYITSNFLLHICEYSIIKVVGKSGSNPEVLIIGGLGNGISNEIVSCKLSTKTLSNKNFPPNSTIAIYGHSAEVLNDNQIILFGGSSDSVKAKGFELVNFNPGDAPNFVMVDNRKKSISTISTSSFRKPKARKFHASCLFEETYLFIFGGMKPNYSFLRDLWIFDFEENQWHEFAVDWLRNDFLEEGIAYHKLVALSSDIENLAQAQNKNEKAQFRIKTEPAESTKKAMYLFKSYKKHILLDVYLFGGIDEQNKIPGSQLWQLGMKNSAFYFSEVEVAGNYRPEARYAHSMNAYPPNRKLIVVGGKNAAGQFLSDVNIFCFNSKLWQRKAVIDNPLSSGIAGHSCDLYESCLIIYGGIGAEGFRSSEILYFNFVK